MVAATFGLAGQRLPPKIALAVATAATALQETQTYRLALEVNAKLQVPAVSGPCTSPTARRTTRRSTRARPGSAACSTLARRGPVHAPWDAARARARHRGQRHHKSQFADLSGPWKRRRAILAPDLRCQAD